MRLLLSNGRRVRRFTVPEMPPSIMSADGLLNTSTPPISSAGTSAKLRIRPLLAVKVSRPFSSERMKFRPRTTTPEPSTEKWSGSTLAAKRLMATPGTRCSASVTERSGRAPMSSAVIESPMISDDCFSCWLLLRLCLMLVTMTSSTVWFSLFAVCAMAGAPTTSAPSASIEAPYFSRVVKELRPPPADSLLAVPI